MKHTIQISLVVIGLLSFGQLNAQSDHKHLREGDKSYLDKDYTNAEEQYRRVIRENDGSLKGNYNLGNAIYEQERFQEALEYYQAAAQVAGDESQRADALHNLGNAFYQVQDFENSINAYKEALKLDPNDMATKYNLTSALRQQRIQQQQQQQRQNQEGEQEQQQQEQQQQQQQQEQQEGEQQQEQQQAPEEQEVDENQEQQPAETREMSKEEAERLLDIIEKEEQKVQEKLRKNQAKGKLEKDW
ncbi:MAG: tetratricopeptide repeat protein [Bacteroidota bacterium]